MKITCIFGYFDDIIYQEILQKSKGVIQYAADALQKAFIKGLIDNNINYNILNVPFIGSFPNRYKSLFSPANVEYLNMTGNSCVNFKNISFCNISLLKNFFKYLELKKQLFEECEKYYDEHFLVIYSAHSPFLKVAIEAKKKYSNIKIILIIPDLPEYMSSSNNFIRNFLKRKDVERIQKFYDGVDGFILLSRYMAERVIRRAQPYRIIEGIYNSGIDEVSDKSNDESNNKIIMYAGTLAKRYGICNLVKAVLMLKRSDFQLQIYGDGDAKNEILEFSKVDNRICYCGQLPREIILEKQRSAYLLVNPRTNEGEYTKYSFPSKTMEYLASGVPTLMYRLKGIPDEYFEYFLSPTDESVESLSYKIDEILNMSKSAIRDFGERAKSYIINKKNPKVQVSKLIELINDLK